MKKELKPGDRVRAYEGANVYVGEVIAPRLNSASYPGAVLIRQCDGLVYSVHARQCVRLKKKPKPERERIERVERWLVKRTDGLTLGYPTKNKADADTLGMNCKHLVEIHEGEQVISREALAAAWDVMPTLGTLEKDAFGFAILCKALGFPVSTKGEGA